MVPPAGLSDGLNSSVGAVRWPRVIATLNEPENAGEVQKRIDDTPYDLDIYGMKSTKRDH
jgi:hypothetical protein